MLANWKNYLAVQMYLAPEDENRIRYLMNKVTQKESHGDARTAKNIAVSNAVEQFLTCWLGHKSGRLFLGDLQDNREFDPRKYEPQNDPLYAEEKAPNFDFELIIENAVRSVLFSSSDSYPGAVDQLIVHAIRVHAFRMKLEDRTGRPNIWMRMDRSGMLRPFSIILQSFYISKIDELDDPRR